MRGILNLLSYVKRPFIGDQTTARLALEPYNGLSHVAYSGIGGHNFHSSPKALLPTTYSLPFVKLSDPSAMGLSNSAYGLNPLTEDTRNI